MSEFSENFHDNFRLATDEPELLVGLHPEEVALFGAEKVVANYRNPASSEQVQALGVRLTELWLDISGESELSDSRLKPVRAFTSRNDFIVTPTAMSNFRPFESTVELEGRAIRPKFLMTTGSNTISILSDIEPEVAVLQQMRQTQEFKYSLLRRPRIKTDPERNLSGSLPASDEDIEKAINFIRLADPLRYPKNYEKAAS